MSTLTELFSNPAAQRIGWALVHFLWQGAAVALVLAVTLAMMRHRSAQARWIVSCGALALMAVLPVATALMVSAQAPRQPESAPTAVTADPMPPPSGEPASAPLPGLAHDQEPFRATPPPAQPAATVGGERTAAVSWPQQLQGAIQPVLPWAILAWLSGVIVMSVWHVGGWLQVRRMRRLGTRPAGAMVQQSFVRVLRRLRIRRPVRLLESLRVAVPVVVGWLRPVILLPVGAVTGLTPQQLEAILAHELAHIRRWDCLVQALQAVMETLLFYHPAVWWVSRRIRQESEQCCDDLAVGLCGDRRGYARALARAAELGARRPAFAAAATGGKLLPRIRRLLGADRPGALSFGRCLSGVLALVTIIAVGIVVGVSCSSQRALQAGTSEAGFSWGKAVNGVQLGAAAADGEPQEIGSAVQIRYVLRNNGGKPVRFYGGPAVEIPGRVAWAGGMIRILAADGRQLPATKAAPFPSPGIDVPAGRSHEGTLDLSKYFDFTRPGEYRVILTLRPHPADDPAGKKGFYVSSGEFTLSLRAPATQPGESSGGGFGPVRERVITSFDAHKPDGFIDFDTGRLLTPPSEAMAFAPLGQLGRAWEPSLRRWVTEARADAGVEVGQYADGTRQARIVGIHLQTVSLSPDQWESASPRMLQEALAKIPASQPTTMESATGDRVFLPADPGQETTIGFGTRDGTLGVLRVVGFTEAPPGLRIRFKTAGRPATQPAVRDASPQTTQPAGLAQIRGFSLQLWSGQENYPYEPFIQEIAGTGANTITFVIAAYQEHASSADVRTDPARVPSDKRLKELIAFAQRQRLRVGLHPIVLLRNPRSGEWRGKILQPNAADADAWWKSYNEYILHYAALAQQAGVELFAVGSQLVSMEDQTRRWTDLIGRVRKEFRGLLTYSANWDHYTGIEFWNLLDLAGLTSYYDLTAGGKDPPTLPNLLQAWKPIRKDLLAWQAKVKKPLLFTEVAWPNQPGAAQEPWNYYAATRTDPEQQKACFEAFFRTWADQPAVGGYLVWEWCSRAGYDTNARTDTSYFLGGKPALEVVRRAFEGRNPAGLAPPAPKGAGTQPAALVHEIHGRAWDATPDVSEKNLAKLAAAASDEQVRWILGGILRRPAPSAVVTLQGESLRREMTTDLEGRFEFAGLPRGEYEISAEVPSRPAGRQAKRMAAAKQQVVLDGDRSVTLELRADLITVTGRITDTQGRPIAGAKVTWIWEPTAHVLESGEAMRRVESRSVSTVSRADGSYELRGLVPPDVLPTARRLNEGNGYSIYHVVRVEADGFEQGKARVLPVTKELHDAARRLLMAWKAQEIRTKGSSKIRAKDGLPVPSSTGNTITNVDVVLARAGAAATQPAPEGAGTQPASAPSDSPATPPARPLAWRDEESEAIVTLSGEGLIKRLGPTASHANAEPPDKFADKGSLIPLDPGLPADPSDIRWQIVGHFYRNLRPGLTLVIRQRVKGQSLDAYWCELGKEGEAFYKPPGPLSRQSAPQPAAAQSRPSIVAGLSCQVRAAKPKLPFNEWPRFEVTLTNVSSEPIDLIATAEWPGGLPGPHYPCASLKITHPDGHYHMPSEDSATANPKAVRIQPGKSWSFTYPSTPDHPTYGEGPLPSLSALLPGVYVAEFAYAVREEVEKRRLGQDLVYAQSAGGPAGKPEKLWTGVVYAEPVKFEVVDDGSPQLAILRDVYAGKGLDKLRLELLLLDEKGPADSRSLRLRLHNTGDQPLYLGCRFGLVTKGPAGQTQPDFSGPRSGQVTAHPPNSQQTLGGWSFDVAGRKPGLYTLWAEYLSMGRDAKLLAKSNEIHLQVPAAPGGAGARPAAEATDDYSRAVARLKQPVPRGQGSPLHKALYKLHADGRRTPDDRELGVIKSLIADSKDIEARDTQGRTALHWGAWDAQLEIITLLLAKGADVSVMADAGWTPLHYAADATNDMQQVRQRVPEVMRLLLRAGADPFADIRPGNLLAGRPIDQVNPRRSRPGLASIVRELEGDTNTPAEIVEVVRLLWEAMEPGRRAALAQARPVAKSFLRSVAENDAAGLVKATWDRDIEMDRPKDWKTTADVIRRRYAGQLGRLTTIQEEEIDRGMAAFKVAPPEGDERWLLVIVARFSDGVWRVVMAEEKQREMTLIQPLEYVVGSHSKRLLVEQSPATQPAPGGAGTQPTTARAMSAVAAEPDQVAEEVTDDPAAAAASSRPAAGPGYEQAFQDLYETLGRRYPCFALKGIAWKKVGQELLPRSRQVKSDQEFGLLCMELVARLEDTHARLEPGAAKLPPAPVPLWDPGFACLIDDRGQPVVYHVDKVSPAQRAGVKVGMTVTSINGKLAGQVLKEQMALLGRYFGYSSQRVLQYDGGRFLARQMQERAKVELGMRDPSGKAYSFELEATLGVRYIPRLPVPIQGIPDSADVSWKMLPDNIGYVRVRRIRANLLASLDKAVAELKSARGLIIDVRGNTGGGFDASAAFDNFSPGKQTHRPQFLGSIAVLVDEHCISAGEGWTSWFVANKRGRLFGSATAGASSRKETYTLSNGLYKVVIPVKAYAGFLHRPIERRGLEPDVPVRITASDLAAGRDTVLDAARQHLLQSPAAQPAPEGAATRPAVR